MNLVQEIKEIKSLLLKLVCIVSNQEQEIKKIAEKLQDISKDIEGIREALICNAKDLIERLQNKK
jgi:hypothetical protein